jgi:hypothetical protein
VHQDVSACTLDEGLTVNRGGGSMAEGVHIRLHQARDLCAYVQPNSGHVGKEQGWAVPSVHRMPTNAAAV